MQAADAVNDAELNAPMRKLAFMNDLVNLGGSYAAIQPFPELIHSDFYLDKIWQSTDLQQNAGLLESYFRQILEGDIDSEALQSTFQFLYSLEFSQEVSEDANKGQAREQLSQTIRRTFKMHGKYQTPPRGGADDPAIKPEHVQRDGVTYVNYPGQLFIKGSGDGRDIWFNDAIQGDLGDCYLMAAMASVAIADPETIRSMFYSNGDGTYSVKLYTRKRVNGVRPVHIRVDQDLPVGDIRFTSSELKYGKSQDIGPNGRELWTSLLEKAYAVMKRTSYSGISDGNAGEALRSITGRPVKQILMDNGLFSWSEDDLLREIKTAISNKRPVLVGTKGEGRTVGEITDYHVYVPLGVASITREVTLYNPQGAKIEKYSISDLRRSSDYIWIGQ